MSPDNSRVLAGSDDSTGSSSLPHHHWRAYNAALRRRGSLEIWFDPQTAWFAAPTGRRGRQPVFSDAAIQTCLMMKALFGLPLRQTTGPVASLVKVAGLDWPTPDFSTLCRSQKGLDVAIGYRPAKGAQCIF